MTSVSVNVPSSVTMVNVPSSFLRDRPRVDFSQGEDEYGRGIPIRLMVDERHLRCLVEVQGDVVVVVAAEIHGAPFCLQSVIMFYYICPVLWTFPVRFHASFTIRHAF